MAPSESPRLTAISALGLRLLTWTKCNVPRRSRKDSTRSQDNRSSKRLL
jgi:hypothetical protein